MGEMIGWIWRGGSQLPGKVFSGILHESGTRGWAIRSAPWYLKTRTHRVYFVAVDAVCWLAHWPCLGRKGRRSVLPA